MPCLRVVLGICLVPLNVNGIRTSRFEDPQKDPCDPEGVICGSDCRSRRDSPFNICPTCLNTYLHPLTSFSSPPLLSLSRTSTYVLVYVPYLPRLPHQSILHRTLNGSSLFKDACLRNPAHLDGRGLGPGHCSSPLAHAPRGPSSLRP